MKKDWFKTWFESDYYQEVYNHRDEKDAQLLCNLILSNVTLSNKSKILDAACGAGRHYIKFAQKGYKVFGFDLSKNLLNTAKRNTLNKNLPLNLFCADLREICIKQEFDLITNLFTSFGYFENDEENFSFIKKAYSYLTKNGFYVLDYFNEKFVRNNLVPYSKKYFKDIIIIEERKINLDRVEKKIIIKENINQKNLDHILSHKHNLALNLDHDHNLNLNYDQGINNPNHQFNEIEYYESVKLYSFNFLIEKIKSIGFKIDRIYGSYSGEEFNENNSQRLILFCKK